MDGTGDVVSEFVKRGEKTEQLCKAGSDSNGEHGIPDEKSNDGVFGNFTFFPSNFGVRKICDDGGNGSSDEIREPDKIIIFDN